MRMTASPTGGAIGRARTFATLALALLGSLAAAPASPAQLFLAFGDSITAGVGDDQGRAEKGYPPRLRDLLIAAGQPGVEVENAGVGGEDTAEGLSRIRPILHDTLAEVLLLMEGTNDIANDISPETTRFNLGKMAEAARESGLTVVHATVIPRIPSAKLDPQNIVTQRMVQGIRQLAGEQSRDLADPFEVFSTTPDVFSRYYAHSNADPVGHPNADGYDLLAEMFFDVLRGVDSVPPVLGSSTPAHAAQGVSTTPLIELDVWDFGSDVDLANTEVLLNGAVLPAQVVANGFPGGARITSQLLSPVGGLVRLRLRSRDTASPPNTVDREVARFLIVGTTFLAGDIDRDGRVDGRDLVELARRFGARASEPRYRASADLNDDGIIDGTDLARLASNFGRSIG
jgi:lysophospholipase L1-like esterase